MRKATITFLSVVLLSGCSSIKSKTEASPHAMAGVKLIQVEDKTNAVLLRATNAGLIAELVDAALQGNGFRTCRAPCEADATATVVVKSYSQKISFNPMTKVAAPKSVIAFSFRLADKAGTILVETESKKSTSVPKDDLAAVMVQDLALKIPLAMQAP